MKTNKSFTKRIRKTKNGKLVTRKAGQNHFNARENSAQKGEKRNSVNLKLSNKSQSRFIPHD